MPETTDHVSDRLLRVTEVADRLQSSRSYVYGLMRSGKLSYVEMPNMRAASAGAGMLGRRIKESALAEFIDSHAVSAATQ